MIVLADTLGITENCPPYKKIREQSPEADSVLREMISLINAIYLPSNQTLLLLSPTASQCDTAGFFTHLALITVGWRGIGVPDSISVACSAYVLCKSQFNSHTVSHTLWIMAWKQKAVLPVLFSFYCSLVINVHWCVFPRDHQSIKQCYWQWSLGSALFFAFSNVWFWYLLIACLLLWGLHPPHVINSFCNVLPLPVRMCGPLHAVGVHHSTPS